VAKSGRAAGKGISGVSVVKVMLAEMAVFVPPVWVKARVTVAGKDPPVRGQPAGSLQNVPGVQSPITLKPTVTDPTEDVIEVLAKLPNTLLPKLKLVSLAGLNIIEPTLSEGMPLKMPVWLDDDMTPAIVKTVAVVIFPVGSAVLSPRLRKPWVLVIVAARTPVARDRHTATADSSDPAATTLGRIEYRMAFSPWTWRPAPNTNYSGNTFMSAHSHYGNCNLENARVGGQRC
jgi:hypothetical protein